MRKIKRLLSKVIKVLKITLKEGPNVTWFLIREHGETFSTDKNEYEKWIEQMKKILWKQKN